MIDRDLAERYRLERKIGQGGMAVVYEGIDTVLRRRVAIKVLRPHLAADEAFVARFFSEAQHAAKLAHPNIVNVYDVGRAGESYYIVMELVEGTTLAEMIASDGRLPERIAIDFAAQLCNGLAYAHRQNLLHRDVKPANVLVTKDDVVKLSDFGIARATTGQTLAMTQPGLVFGSVSYLSPEQAQGRELGPPSDLYSLGVVLYEMLSGELPFVGDSPITVALHHVSSPAPALDPDELEISPALAAIVRRLLAKDPADRYPSAAAVGSALREARERPGGSADAPAAVPGAPTRRVVPPPPPRPSPYPDRPSTSAPSEAEREGERAEAVRGRRGSPAWLVVSAILILILVLAGLAGYLTMRPGGWAGRTSLPAVASVVGRSVSAARRTLAAEGLRSRIVPESSAVVPVDRVISQEPAAGELGYPNTAVRLVVSTGPAPVALIDLRNYSRDDAVRYLLGAKLVAHVLGRYDARPVGQVLDQRPGPGTAVPEHSTVRLVVSKGRSPVAVPDLASLTLADAKSTLASRSLALTIAERDQNDQIPPGVVISQVPAAGATVSPGGAVAVVVSAGPPRLAVPDVKGRSVSDARAALQAIGLTPAVEEVVDATAAGGSVLKIEPSAGAQVTRGATVTLSIAVNGAVPDVSGQDLPSARAALENDGYRVGNVAYVREGATGAVVRTEPTAGTQVRPGETVNVFVGGDPEAHP